MTSRIEANVISNRSQNVGTPEIFRAQGKCFLCLGIVLIVIGVASVVVSISLYIYVTGIGAMVALWGIVCLLIAYCKFQTAKSAENITSAVPVQSISGDMTTGAAQHPTATVFQNPTATPYGFQQQHQFSSLPYSSPFPNSRSTYSAELPPYSAHSMYASPEAPPSYKDTMAL